MLRAVSEAWADFVFALEMGALVGEGQSELRVPLAPSGCLEVHVVSALASGRQRVVS